MQDFGGTTAVITGTANTRGIGMAIARALGGLGCALVPADLDGGGVATPASELRAGGVDAIAVCTDMGDRAEALIARARPDPYLWGPASNLLGS